MSPPEDVRLSFDDVAEIYDRARPGYPGALFDELFDRLPDEPEIVEVGPGTGQATRELVARGAVVHAIEIGPALAAALATALASDRLRVTVGDFEQVSIGPGTADVVLSASAYHWISPAAQTDRPATILRPQGTVAIIDLIQVDAPEDAGFFAACQPIYARYGQHHTGPPAPRREDADPAIRRALEADGRFSAVAVHRYDWDQTYRAADYRQLMLSYSVTQMMEGPDRHGLLDDVEAFIRSDFGGRVTRPLVATLTTASLG